MAVMRKRVSILEETMQKLTDEHMKNEKEMNKKWGELANKRGTIVEDIVAPNIPTIAAAYFGQKTLGFFAYRVRKEHPEEPGRIREFDIIAIGGKYLFLNETKSTPRQEYLKTFADNHREVFEYFPEYKDKILVPIFSSLSLSREAVDYLTTHSIYAMAMKGDTMDLLNFEEVNGR